MKAKDLYAKLAYIIMQKLHIISFNMQIILNICKFYIYLAIITPIII
jgi:hypothetical protein